MPRGNACPTRAAAAPLPTLIVLTTALLALLALAAPAIARADGKLAWWMATAWKGVVRACWRIGTAN